MAFSPLDSKLFGLLFSDAELAGQFSDERFVRYLIEVEVALAHAQAKLNVIPASAAHHIAAAADIFHVDIDRLCEETERAGLPIVELVRQFRLAVGEAHGMYVHWGATSQDIMDTALVLQIRAALQLFEGKLRTVIANLVQLTESHKQTLMSGRTHSQQALPLTFGLKTAGWLAPLVRHMQRLNEFKPRVLTIQLGGAAGTLASMADSGLLVQKELAEHLDLHVPILPWHTQRDALAELAGWLSLVSGSLAKMAQDIILMAQSEVGEIRESSDPTRGSSSTMPQKSNPIVSEVIIAAARSNAQLLASMHGALIQEHERATHGWQMEWLSLPQMIGLTGTALNKAIFLSEHLTVDSDRMSQNVHTSNGLILAEAAVFALTEHMNRAQAKQLVSNAVQTALEQNLHLIEVLRGETSVAIDWDLLKDETAYLGSTEAFITRVVSAANVVLGVYL